MEFLTHNFIADMRGPQFLALYFGVIVTVLVVTFLRLRRRDPTRGTPPPNIPATMDPYEVAFLRGGKNEVLRVIILSLIHRGYLKLTGGGDGSIQQDAKHPDPRHLSKVEKSLFEWFAMSRDARGVFEFTDHTTEFDDWCLKFEGKLLGQELLLAPGSRRVGYAGTAIAGALIAGLGLIKLTAAVLKGRYNVGFLVVMGIVGVILAVAILPRALPRVSAVGRAYLESLKVALAQLKSGAVRVTAQPSDDLLLLLVSVFGIGALEGTLYASYPQMFEKAASRGGNCGGGCGSVASSSCSSSCGSGSSCGGGGCGGGGCGGCGG